MSDPNCICEGNWRAIVADAEPMIGYDFIDRDGDIWNFFGIVWGNDDFYYGMRRGKETLLLSCVGSIEDFGFSQLPSEDPSASREGNG